MLRGKTAELLMTIEELKGSAAILAEEVERLRLGEERHQSLFKNLPFSLQVVDKDGAIVEVNPYHIAHMGGGRTKLADYRGQNIWSRKSVIAAGLAPCYKAVLEGIPFERTEVLYPALSGGGKGYFNVRGVPLWKGREIVGAIYILEDVSVLKRAKDELILANEKLRGQMEEIRLLQTELVEQVIRDPLTSLYNRRYLDETLDRELSRARRESYQIGLVMIDIDNFKEINDGYGHHAGDLVLKNLAGQLTKLTRSSDLVCRLGGDEFLIVLLNVKSLNVFDRAEKYRRCFEQAATRVDGLDLRSTISVGTAMFPEQGSASSELMMAADRALYDSKRRGRNCVSA